MIYTIEVKSRIAPYEFLSHRLLNTIQCLTGTKTLLFKCNYWLSMLGPWPS